MEQPLTDAQVHAALLLLNDGRVALRRRPKLRPARPIKLERTCKDCGFTLPLGVFVHVKGRRDSYYPTCRRCRMNVRASAIRLTRLSENDRNRRPGN